MQKVCKARPEDINLNCGVGVEAGTMNYYVIDNYPFLNGFSEENSEKMEKEFGYRIKEAIPVRIMPIDELINKNCSLEYPDILDIDTEGMDLDILSRIDYGRFSPKVIIVETVIFGSFRKDTGIMLQATEIGGTFYLCWYQGFQDDCYVRAMAEELLTQGMPGTRLERI